MNYRFVLQASAPHALKIRDSHVRTVADAVESVFPLETECAMMVWNWIHVPLGYRYDISLMIDDAVRLITRQMSTEQGNERICWPSNTFASTWDVEWSGGMTAIHALWESVVGDTEPLLRQRPDVRIQTADFLAEWKRPLETVADALTGAGYEVEQLSGMRELLNVIALIERPGI